MWSRSQSSGRHRFESVASATGSPAKASVAAATAGSIAMNALNSMPPVSRPQGCMDDVLAALIAYPSRTKSARELSKSIIAGGRLIVGAQEFHHRSAGFRIFSNDLERNQCGRRQQNSCDPPKESAEPQSQKYQEWVDLKSPTDQQRLRNLALNGGQRKIRACHSDHLPKGIEGYNGHQRDDEHGGRRACIRNVVENRRHSAPEVWRRHAPGPHR